jgi:hypothetical protein
MTVRCFFAMALLVGFAAATANADEPTTRVFHIGIVAGLPRSSPEHVTFEDRGRAWKVYKAATCFPLFPP